MNDERTWMCLRPVEHICGQMTLYTDDVKRKTTKLLIDWLVFNANIRVCQQYRGVKTFKK